MGDIAKITAQLIQNPGIAAEYDRINGEYTAFKAQYDKLLGQREQVRLRGEVQTETDAVKIELLDPPSKPTSPAAPHKIGRAHDSTPVIHAHLVCRRHL